jgi:hypothetical protein
MRISTRSRWLGAGIALAATLALTACGTPPWQDPAANPAVTSTPKPTPSEITTVVNELANGSTQHQLTAGDITLTVDYFSTLNMGDWTADANKPLSISMSAALGHDDGQRVYLSQMNVIVAVNGPDGALTSPAALSDRSTVNPGYLVKKPYSYSQTFVLPAVDKDATYLTLSITYELLLQTTPTSSEYSKQTASDTLTIAIAPQD